MASTLKVPSPASGGASLAGKSVADSLLDVAIGEMRNRQFCVFLLSLLGRFQWPQGALLLFLPPGM